MFLTFSGRLRLRGFAPALAAVLSIAVAASAQGPATAPTATQPAGTQPASAAEASLAQGALEAELAGIEAAANLDEALKSQLIEQCKSAIGDLKKREEQLRQRAEFERALQEAPATLESIRARLAEAPEEAPLEIAPDATLQQLEQHLAQAEAQLKAAQDKAAELDSERARRQERRAKAPESLAAARQELERLSTEALPEVTPAEEDVPAEVARVRRAARQARRSLLEAQIASIEMELASFDARGELLTARRDLAAREVTQAEALVRRLQERVNERRRREAERAAREAERERRRAAGAPEALRKLAEENAALAELRVSEKIADRIAAATQANEEISRKLERISGEYKSVQAKVEAAGLTHAIGLLLRKQREGLMAARDHRRAIDVRKAEISAVQVRTLELEEQRAELADIGLHLRAVMAEVDASLGAAERGEIEAAARELLAARRGILDALLSDYSTYFTKLVDLDADERQLIREMEAFAGYIDERILWIRSTAVPQRNDLLLLGRAAGWLAHPATWLALVKSAWASARAEPVVSGLGVLLLVLMAAARPQLHARLTAMGQTAARSHCHEFSVTAAAVALTMALAVWWPFLVWFLGWRLGAVLDAPESVRATAAGAEGVALGLARFELLRHAIRPMGLAEAHFGWSGRKLRIVGRWLLLVIVIGVTAAFVVHAVLWTGDAELQNSVGRFAFLATMAILAVFANRVLRPAAGILVIPAETKDNVWRVRLRRLIHPAVVLLPIVLGGAAIAGYFYTSVQIMFRIWLTLWLVVGLTMLHALALRWLLISRRKLAIQEARKRAQAAEQQSAEPSAEGMAAAKEPEIDLSSIGEQTQRLVRSVFVLGLFLVLWLVWEDILPALRVLDRVTLWSTAETVEGVETLVPITAGSLMLSLIILLATMIGVRNLPGLLEITILRRLPLDAGERYAITTISKYVITAVGLVWAFGTLGLGWSKLQWLLAAVSVGLGFGLQEIFANFVSGLILLFERPIRVGDFVTVGATEGKVTRIQMRATTITDWDCRELVVPNKQFITGEFKNWTLSDTSLRIVIPVGIAYGSDTKLAHDLLLKIASENRHVLADPAPHVIFLAFGDSALNFELRVFLANRDHVLDVINGLRMAIHDEFRRAGIEIAFPQMDVHIRSIGQPLAVEGLRGSDEAGRAGGAVDREGPAPA